MRRLMDEAPDILDWFRAEPVSRTKFLLISGTVFVFLGSPTLGAAFIHTLPESTRTSVGMLGAVMLLTGLFTAFGGLAMLLSHDDYLAIRLDGVVLHKSKSETILRWGDLNRVVLDDRKTSLVFMLTRPDMTTSWHIGTTAPALALHLDDLRRKGTSGILRAAQCKFTGAR
jgi:hypothetical protein